MIYPPESGLSIFSYGFLNQLVQSNLVKADPSPGLAKCLLIFSVSDQKMADLTVLAKSWRVLSPAVRIDGRSGVVKTAEFCNKGLLNVPMLASKEEG